jgi:hypothetical protein
MASAATAKLYVTEAGDPLHGILAEFPGPGELFHAAEAVRDAGYTKWDTFTPFPIHGMEQAMGVKPTVLPRIIAAVGLTGAALGFLMQYWMQGVDYPLVTQGKPYDSWQAFVPITFECGILLSAFTAIGGMLAMNGLPRHHHPLLKKERFLSSSDDRFFIAIESADPRFDPHATRALLERAGATSIELVEE